MRQRKKSFRSLLFIVTALLSCAGFVFLISFFPPDYQLTFFGLKLSILSLFFTLLFLVLFCAGTVLLKSKTQGLLISLFVICYLLFRLNNFTHPFFFVLLASLFLTLELLFTYKK